jgi:uncharacterized protein YjbI with pentapeptide repeats
LQGAHLAFAQLQGAVLSNAILRDVDLHAAQMQGADLGFVRERRYDPSQEHYTTRYMKGVDLRGAWLVKAQLQGARLFYAQMQGARLQGAQMQGASLWHSDLTGAHLDGAQMQAADLGNADIRGANLSGARMQGANLINARMEGARFDDTSLTLAQVRHAHVWRARGANCQDAQVTELQLDLTSKGVEAEASQTNPVANFLEQLVTGLSKPAERQVREQLMADAEHDDATKDLWRACETKARTHGDYERRHADYLIELACDTKYNQMYLTYGIYSNWVDVPDDYYFLSSGPISKAHQRAVIGGLLGSNDRDCPGAKELGERIIERLRDLARAD